MSGKLKARFKETNKAGSSSTATIPAAVSPKSKSRKESKKPKAGKAAEKEVLESASDEDEEDWEDDEDGEDSEDDDEDDGVDEEGMKKLMKALGEGGLDDVGQMQLDALEGVDGESDDEGGEGEGEDEEGSDEDEEEEDAEEDEIPAVKKGKTPASAKAKNDSDDSDEDQIALEDAESVDEDAVPHQKITLDNKVALERIRDTIALDSSLPWTETLAVTYPETIEVDVNDDLNRELAFYKQALHGANAARALAATHSLPFTRPSDYFAEMVKSDAHMERIRQRLLDEGASIKKSEDKRREREGKKFGKQVQVEKLRERERSKKEMEERLKGLKRKNKDVLNDVHGAKDDDAFDVAVEDAISARPSKRARPSDSNAAPDSKKNSDKISRRGRDAKFGFGGKGRRDKQNTRESTEKFDFGGGRGGRGGATGRGRGGARGGGGRGGGRGGSGGRGGKRLGKSRRMSSRG